LISGLEDVVILDVPARALQVPVALLVGRGVGFVEDIELQLRTHLRGPAAFRQAGELFFEN
jgi:hypothetical protein